MREEYIKTIDEKTYEYVDTTWGSGHFPEHEGWELMNTEAIIITHTTHFLFYNNTNEKTEYKKTYRREITPTSVSITTTVPHWFAKQLASNPTEGALYHSRQKPAFVKTNQFKIEKIKVRE